MKRPILYLMCGPAGVGKTTWCRNHLKDGEILVSRDDIRFELLGADDMYFEHESKVLRIFINRIKEGLKTGHNVYADATHLNWRSRHQILKHLNCDNIDVIPVIFNISVYVCLEQNANREGLRKVPEDVIYDMYRRFSFPTHDNFNYADFIFVEEGPW